MTSKTRIKKWGNSFGIIIPKATLAQLHVNHPDGQELEMRVVNNKLVLEPQRLPDSIDELFAGFDYEKYNQSLKENAEVDFGKPEGDELW